MRRGGGEVMAVDRSRQGVPPRLEIQNREY